jgi:hypothetical protein
MSTPSRVEDDGRHDFDFIFGDWTIHNRKLRDVADPACDEWVEFATTSHAEPVFGGLAHFDHITSGPDAPGGPWEGLTLRQFDPRDRLWRIWWASTRNPGRLDPPLAGRFTDGTGTFTGEDTLAGEPINLRFYWTQPIPGRARWTQEFSYDAGNTWQLNWIMEFSPRAAGRAGG